MTDIEQTLRSTAARWRAVQPVPPSISVPPVDKHKVSRPAWRRPVLRVFAPVTLVAVAAGVLIVVTRHHDGTEVTTGGDLSVPAAKPPLLRSMPATTGAFQIAAGSAGGSWSLWVKINPLTASPPNQSVAGHGFSPSFGPGLDMEVVTPRATGGGGDDPTHMESLVWRTFGPEPGFPAELVYGVTSTPAAEVRITFTGSTAPLVAPVYTNPVFGPLRFYAVAAPASAAGEGIVAEAIAADGTPLVRTKPNLNGPPVPNVTQGSKPGDTPLWPLPDSRTGSRDSAAAVARDFATAVLGIPHPNVTASSSGSVGPTVVAIQLPASRTTLRVLAQLASGRWEVIGFIDPANQHGIGVTGGHAIVALHAPADTDSAEAIVLSNGKVDRVPIDKAEIDAGTAVLPEQNIQALVIVYHDVNGATVGAGGGTY